MDNSLGHGSWSCLVTKSQFDHALVTSNSIK
jgi:hypothetical protein